MARVARVWQTLPSRLAGLESGTASAYIVDRVLALRILEEERRERERAEREMSLRG